MPRTQHEEVIQLVADELHAYLLKHPIIRQMHAPYVAEGVYVLADRIVEYMGKDQLI